MGNFLAIDTSLEYMSVVAVKNGEVFSTFLPDCAMKHSVSLMPTIEETLQKANLTLEECDFFACSVGAGSFTGIRIGISAVKGLCLALSKPALPVTSFEIAAYNAIGADGKMLCLVDALHDAYYVCGFEKGEVCFAPAYLTEEEVLDLEKEGYTLYATTELPIAEKARVTLVDPVDGFVKACLALSKKGAFGEPTALYVRKSSAELNAAGKV